ncbi:nitrous oxide reductase family maturation protein NosD [Chitinophaga defluvii]|uniref:Nitrous oxide reductase family maturation protein NosD n=1 Tax=Chitinophaga defluvii TaxID=3163343 RepID=A0ABV2T0G9_9BACT
MQGLVQYFFLCFLLLTMPALYAQQTITVSAASEVKTITAALDKAGERDTILVKAGVYREGHIIVKKTVYLKGEGWPEIDAQGKDEGITIMANGVIMEGFRVVHSNNGSLKDYAGIRVHKSNQVQIINNRLERNFFGIYLAETDSCTVRNNQVSSANKATQSGNGIHVWKSYHATITDNHINGHRDGIYFEFVRQSRIINNVSEGNIRYGLHFMFSDDDVYERNIFRKNGSGVAVMYTKRIQMLHNEFDDNWGSAAYGLLLKDITDSHISGNRFRKNTVAIYLEGSSRIDISKNTFVSNGWAVRLLANCEQNTFSRNNFISNTFDVTTNGTLNLNLFEHNYWDKYEGYDLNKDQVGDVPYRPMSLYSQVVEKVPAAVILLRSFMVNLLDRAEKSIPSLTPESVKDETPVMKKYNYD